MKVRLGEGKEYIVEPEILDLLALQYGNLLLEKYEKLDTTIQFGGKLLGKRMVGELAKTFNISPKLPRGSDPIVYLIRAWTVLMRQSLEMAVVQLVTDEAAGTIVDNHLTYEGMEHFQQEMAGYLERLKTYASAANIPRLAEGSGEMARDGGDTSDTGRGRPELATGGDEAQREDDGGKNHRLDALPAFS